MPQTQSIVQRRRARRADERRAHATRLQMGGVGLGMIVSFLLALLILLAALAYANLTSDLPNVELLPALLNPPDGLLLQPTRIYDRTGQHLLLTFAPQQIPRAAIFHSIHKTRSIFPTSSRKPRWQSPSLIFGQAPVTHSMAGKIQIFIQPSHNNLFPICCSTTNRRQFNAPSANKSSPHRSQPNMDAVKSWSGISIQPITVITPLVWTRLHNFISAHQLSH